jgi:hypothetical protein
VERTGSELGLVSEIVLIELLRLLLGLLVVDGVRASCRAILECLFFFVVAFTTRGDADGTKVSAYLLVLKACWRLVRSSAVVEVYGGYTRRRKFSGSLRAVSRSRFLTPEKWDVRWGYECGGGGAPSA